MAGDGEEDQDRRPSASQRDDDPTPAPDPEEAWETWVAGRPMFEALLDRRIRTVQRLSAAVAVGAVIVFVSAIIIESRPPGVALFWILGGFSASTALVAGGDHVRYRTAWGRRTGTFTKEDIERKGVPLPVAVQTYLRDSARAVEGQDKAFTHFVTSIVFTALLWSLSALLFLG